MVSRLPLVNAQAQGREPGRNAGQHGVRPTPCLFMRLDIWGENRLTARQRARRALFTCELRTAHQRCRYRLQALRDDAEQSSHKLSLVATPFSWFTAPLTASPSLHHRTGSPLGTLIGISELRSRAEGSVRDSRNATNSLFSSSLKSCVRVSRKSKSSASPYCLMRALLA